MKNTSVAIIIPAYNEEPTIGKVIKGLKKILSSEVTNFKIIVVDDGSKDNTAKIADQSGAYVINHVLNTGTGGATATGLSYAYQEGYDIAATIDADGQHDPIDVLKGITMLAESDADLLLGSRLIDPTGMTKVKLLGNKGLTLLTYIIFGIKVTDSQSGMRIFSKKALDQLKWKTAGYEFCSEMLWRARQQRLIIKEYPIKAIYTDYSSAKGQNNWNGVNIIKSLVQRRILEIFGE